MPVPMAEAVARETERSGEPVTSVWLDASRELRPGVYLVGSLRPGTSASSGASVLASALASVRTLRTSVPSERAMTSRARMSSLISSLPCTSILTVRSPWAM